MIVNKDQVKLGVKKYVENELAQKATGITKFAIYFMMPSIDQTIVSYINTLQSNTMFEDLFDANKNIELDKVYERALFAMDKSGNKLILEKYGLSLDKSDVQKIYDYIKAI
jgi:hypothetical protein